MLLIQFYNEHVNALLKSLDSQTLIGHHIKHY